MAKSTHTEKPSAPSAGLCAVPVAAVVTRPVCDPGLIDRDALLREAQRQTEPFVRPGSRSVAAHVIRKTSAHPRGISLDTGANRPGKAAETVVTDAYCKVHAGGDHRMVNPPLVTAPNVVDVRAAPDAVSKRDVWFLVETKDGRLIPCAGGQVKTGSPKYITRSLVKMTRSEGYGKLGILDASYVNPDGTPRVGPGGFTERQARRLRNAGVRLRGVEDLEARASQLVGDVDAFQTDGLTPTQRAELVRLRDDIARAYSGKGVAGRVAGGAAIGFATGAVLSIALQKAAGCPVDVAAVTGAAVQSALIGGGCTLADSGLYHFASRALSHSPEAAKAFAQRGVAGGMCAIAIAADVSVEVQAVRAGERTVADAVAGGAAKSALNLLPLLLAPLGLLGIPVLLATQVGGRWAIQEIRARDAYLTSAFEADMSRVEAVLARSAEVDREALALLEEAAETDRRFDAVIGASAYGDATSGPAGVLPDGDLDDLFARVMAGAPSTT